MDGFDVIKEINGQKKKRKKEKEKKNKKSFKEKLKKFFKVCLWVLLALIGVPFIYALFASLQEYKETNSAFFLTLAFLETLYCFISAKKRVKEAPKLLEEVKNSNHIDNNTLLEICFLRESEYIAANYYKNGFIKIVIIILGAFWLNTSTFILLYLIHNTAFKADVKHEDNEIMLKKLPELKNSLLTGEKIRICYGFQFEALLKELFPKCFENKDVLEGYNEIFQEIKDKIPIEKVQMSENLIKEKKGVLFSFCITRDFTSGFETVYDTNKENYKTVVYSSNIYFNLFNKIESEKIKHLLAENSYKNKIDYREHFQYNKDIEFRLTCSGIEIFNPFENNHFDYIQKISYIPTDEILNIFQKKENLCGLGFDFDLKKSISDLLKKYPHNKIRNLNLEDNYLSIKNKLFFVDIFYTPIKKPGFYNWHF